MSRPNVSDDPEAPLLAGDDRPHDENESTLGNRKITIFNRTFSLFHLVVVITGLLALAAIGVSIAAIGLSHTLLLLLIPIILIINPVLSVEHRETHHKLRKHHPKGTAHVCITPECVQLSADILRSLGDADPCDNFYDCPFQAT